MRNLKKVLSLVLAMAMMLSVMVVGAGATSLGDYTDNDKVSAEYAVAVDVASQLGILEGVGANKYNPQGNLTRAQLATMTYRITTADVTDVYTANFAGGAAENFTDTPADAWFAGYVGYAADAGYLKGVGDGLYKPNSYLTGYQALAAFLRAIGYNEPGQFTGSDWTVKVAQIANQVGALKGITGVDLNKAITREVAAQIIYNILFSDEVAYTPAFGYQNSLLKDDLASDEFEIVSAKAGDEMNVAPWGQPATVWVNEDGEAAVTIMAEPVATYKTAVSDCQIAKDLGLTKDESGVVVFDNGNKSANKTIDISNTAKTNGGQGTLTEVYKVDGDYQIVEIDTWLAQVTGVTKATFDKAGHKTGDANTTLKVWDGPSNIVTSWTVETEAFAKESYVLLNYSNFQAFQKTITGDNGRDDTVTFKHTPEKGIDFGVLNLTAATPVASGEMTAYNKTAETSTIGGTAYNWAEKFGLGYFGTIDKTYDVYADAYGNVIGLIESETVYTYGIVTKMAWADSYLPLDDAKAYANILDFSANAENNVVMDNFLGAEFVGVNTDTVPQKAPSVSTDADNNVIYYDFAVQFKTLSDGSKAITDVGKTADITIKAAVTNTLAGTYSTNDNTVYLVKTGNADDGYTYTSYTGYKNVPSMENVNVTYFGETDGYYVTYMFVDATDAIFTGSSFVAYIGDNTHDSKDGALFGYEMYVDGAEVTKYAETDALTGFEGHGLYEVTVDADGYILSVQAATKAGIIDSIDGVTACTGTVITNGAKAMNHQNAPVYLVDTVADTVEAGEYADAINKNVVIVLDDDKNAEAFYVVVK